MVMTRNTKGPATLEPGELDKTSDPFWSERSLEQLAANQGIAPINQLEDAWGKGAELWADDEDFKAFLTASEGIPSEKG
jgi:hypothetical protein